ncbi:hypothetical protein SAMN05216228_10794 [Rhizobium tibeticum]|uniref:Uncharacterized protein n=1 Tax=Rhizobium tibeticum TaxID=501024 RepID=A0A1H8WUR1_9HYPH|nr:hypothetical protein RTCCBAU85039_6120 [Rhizobium tibeticum]SEP31177.1 hypothetical protein SAMN05216228_10794 [Rhizobium tibeticum]
MLSDFESLIAAVLLIEKRWVNRSFICAGTKFADTVDSLTWKGTVCLKDETRRFLPVLTASRPLFIPPIKPAKIQFVCFLFHWIADCLGQDQPG